MPQMTPEDSLTTKKVVLAAMKLMYDDKGFNLFKSGLSAQAPMANKLAGEAAGLIKIVNDKANGGIPRQVLIPAAIMLALDIAGFIEQTGAGHPTPQDVDAAAKMIPGLILKAIPNVRSRMQPPNPILSRDQTQQPAAAQPPARRGIIQSAMPGGV